MLAVKENSQGLRMITLLQKNLKNEFFPSFTNCLINNELKKLKIN